MPGLLQLTCYSLLIGIASYLGGGLPLWLRMTHTRAQMMMSFVAGLMLGAAVFVLLPHALEDPRDRFLVFPSLIFGLLLMLFLLRAFHFHQHVPSEIDHEHDHDHLHGPGCAHHHHQDVSWLGISIGLAIHTLLDGVALGALLRADGNPWLSMGLFLAILLHKPLDAFAITTTMTKSGVSTGWKKLANLMFALLVPLAAFGMYFGVLAFESQERMLSCSLAFSAGAFLCISLSDLLPEIQFHTHDRIKLSMLLLLGVLLSWGAGFLHELTHVHEDHDPHTEEQARELDHKHSGHNH